MTAFLQHDERESAGAGRLVAGERIPGRSRGDEATILAGESTALPHAFFGYTTNNVPHQPEDGPRHQRSMDGEPGARAASSCAAPAAERGRCRRHGLKTRFINPVKTRAVSAKHDRAVVARERLRSESDAPAASQWLGSCRGRRGCACIDSSACAAKLGWTLAATSIGRCRRWGPPTSPVASSRISPPSRRGSRPS